MRTAERLAGRRSRLGVATSRARKPMAGEMCVRPTSDLFFFLLDLLVIA
jgi:hypothetical protein